MRKLQRMQREVQRKEEERKRGKRERMEVKVIGKGKRRESKI